jgi:hypothetical protein
MFKKSHFLSEKGIKEKRLQFDIADFFCHLLSAMLCLKKSISDHGKEKRGEVYIESTSCSVLIFFQPISVGSIL